jgi:hypothetical protein
MGPATRVIHLAITAELAERRLLTPVNRSNRRTADVRENEATHTQSSRVDRHVDRGGVASGAASEADGARPARCLGKHQVSIMRPAGKCEEFRCPDNPFIFSVDRVAVRAVGRVCHGARGYVEPGFDK